MLEKLINYNFSDMKILKEALTHPSISYVDEHKNSYERLEFLGDTVLSMIVAKMLFIHFPNESEGDLSKRHVELVKGETLAKIASDINLGQFIVMSQGEKDNGGQKNIRNLENTMEALIGAIYIDGGIECVKDFIFKYWMPIISQMESPPKNVKSTLQEWAQQRSLPIPQYKLLDASGPPHSPVFRIELSLNGFIPVVVKAKNKRAGEQMAAKLMLEQHILNNA